MKAMQLNSTMRFRIPAEMASALAAAAARRCVSQSAFVRQTLAEQLRHDKRLRAAEGE